MPYNCLYREHKKGISVDKKVSMSQVLSYRQWWQADRESEVL